MIDDLEPPPSDPEETGEPIVETTTGAGRKKRENRIKRERREAKEFWLAVLNSPIGRRELWNLFCGASGAHAFETRFVCGPGGFPDPNAVWHEHGVQEFGLRAYRFWLTIDPAAVATMHQENDPLFPKPDRSA